MNQTGERFDRFVVPLVVLRCSLRELFAKRTKRVTEKPFAKRNKHAKWSPPVALLALFVVRSTNGRTKFRLRRIIRPFVLLDKVQT